MMDSVFLDLLGLLDLLDQLLIWRIFSSMQLMGFLTSLLLKDHQGPQDLRVCQAELDFLGLEDPKGTWAVKAFRVYLG